MLVEPAKKDKTTIVTSKALLDRIAIHCKRSGESQTDFITRALMNQLEYEGDYDIRFILEEESEDE